MEHFGQPRTSTSRVIVNGSLSPTNSTVASPRTRSRHRTEYGGLQNHHDKGSTPSWRSQNQPTNYLSLSPPHPSFGMVPTSSASPNNTIHGSLQSLPTGLHQSINGLAYQHGPGNSSHVFGSSKSIFGTLNTQHTAYKMPSHRNVEHEEAMDIDAQEDMDTGHTSFVGPMASQSKTLRSDASSSDLESAKVMYYHSFPCCY